MPPLGCVIACLEAFFAGFRDFFSCWIPKCESHTTAPALFLEAAVPLLTLIGPGGVGTTR
jgi:hypothetical protein